MHNIAIISTSANPLHAGHLAMAEWGDKNGYKVLFEIPSVNADKGKIDEVDLDNRRRQCYNICRPVISMPCATFFAKAKSFMDYRDSICHQFNNYTGRDLRDEMWSKSFFVGYDTIIRVDDVKYYYGSAYERDRLIDSFQGRFIVFERGGKSDLSVLSTKLRERCTLAQNYIGINISSTELRHV